MNTLIHALQKLITDNWPGLEGHYRFTVPCPTRKNGKQCNGRFDIGALQDFLKDGDAYTRCQTCRTKWKIIDLLYGFKDVSLQKQLDEINQKLDGLDSRIANYVMSIMRAMANEAKEGPRLFTIEPVDGDWRRWATMKYRLHLWCEAEDCQHPVFDDGKGVYEYEVTPQWLIRVAPYANFTAGVIKTLLPMVAPAVTAAFPDKTFDELGITNHLDLIEKATEGLMPDGIETRNPGRVKDGVLTEDERSGILALHGFLREKDPNHEQLGLYRVPTITGDYRWLCRKHYDEFRSKIPETIEE